jgi:hypothetical protein
LYGNLRRLLTSIATGLLLAASKRISRQQVSVYAKHVLAPTTQRVQLQQQERREETAREHRIERREQRAESREHRIERREERGEKASHKGRTCKREQRVQRERRTESATVRKKGQRGRETD